MPDSLRPSRRVFFQAAGAAGLAAACAPAAAPPPAATGGAPSPGGGTAKPAWQEEWDKWVAAARQEGKVSIVNLPGTGFKDAIAAFEKAYPGIAVESQTFASASLLIPKVQQERNAGIYSFDAAVLTIQSLLTTLKPEGAFDPIRPALIRPDVTDDKSWRSGFDNTFMDSEKKWVIAHYADAQSQLWVNSDLVKDGEIKNLRDLLDPKWKGKILLADVRTGDSFPMMTAIRMQAGDAAVRALLIDQQPAFRRSRVEVAQEMVRGRYAVASGLQRAILQEYWDQGLGKSLKPVDVPEARTVTGGGVWLFNKAPHPNAARVFVNWVLSKEGGEAWSKAEQKNSTRADVAPNDPESLPDPKKDYIWMIKEANIPKQNDARKFMEDLLK